MWSRRLSETVMPERDFNRALILGLQQGEASELLSTKISDAVSEAIKGEMIPICATLDKLRKELASSAAVAELQSTINWLRAEMRAKDNKILELERKVSVLETSLDDLEQYTRRNSLRLQGLPELEGEETTEVALKAINENLQLTPPLSTQELDRVHRVGPRDNNKPRGIIIKFATYRSRQRVYSKKKDLFTREPNKPRLFLNEDLTKPRAQLLAKARSYKRDNRLKGAWSADGRLLVLTNRNVVRPIRSITDLEQIVAETRTPANPAADSTQIPATITTATAATD